MADTVASISFNNNHSISMDIEDVTAIEITDAMELSPGNWACSLIVRSAKGAVALQLLADSREKLGIVHSEG
ncbi:MAG: hypothetical protein HQL44_02465 [Alphaproteobacteria bacterium]|nr:hypothetical protein [Alphaproteobacteria bacterium]